MKNLCKYEITTEHISAVLFASRFRVKLMLTSAREVNDFINKRVKYNTLSEPAKELATDKGIVPSTDGDPIDFNRLDNIRDYFEDVLTRENYLMLLAKACTEELALESFGVDEEEETMTFHDHFGSSVSFKWSMDADAFVPA